MVKSIGIVGYGSFGRLLHTLASRYLPDIEVKVFSRNAQPDEQQFSSLESVAKCDAVILAVPISNFESVLLQVLPLLGAESILVDIATVKKHTTDLLKKYAADRRYIATHPMFGPESYKKTNADVTGYRVVITDTTLDQVTQDAIDVFLGGLGFSMIHLSAENHDKYLADTLFLTHYISQTLDTAGFVRTPVDTVSFGFLMDAVETVRDKSGLFKDVFDHNDYCRKTIQKIRDAEQKIQNELLYQSDKNVKRTGAVAYLGPAGTYSEKATRALFPHEHDLVPVKTISGVFDAVLDGRFRYGVVPSENSVEGPVKDTIAYILRLPVRVINRFRQPINHCLLSYGTEIGELKVIRSHPQALGQCRQFLKTHAPHAELEPTASTSAPLEETKDPRVGFIASKETAAQFDANVLKENIGDYKNIQTEFYVIEDESKAGKGHSVAYTAILLLSMKDRVGALRDILDVFANNSLNLSRILSVPTPEREGEFSFLIDVEIRDKAGQYTNAQKELEMICSRVRVIGEVE